MDDPVDARGDDCGDGADDCGDGADACAADGPDSARECAVDRADSATARADCDGDFAGRSRDDAVPAVGGAAAPRGPDVVAGGPAVPATGASPAV